MAKHTEVITNPDGSTTTVNHISGESIDVVGIVGVTPRGTRQDDRDRDNGRRSR